MLELILKLYRTSMVREVRSPVPHLFGPPGVGKSTFVEQAAAMLGVSLHIINVSRISPLELEGVQMPDTEGLKLNLLLATLWNKLEEGDIVLLDEFLRGFPEVYNGLLDIMTSRTVAGHKLPNVFFIAASNSTIAYDKALEDRLMHLPVPDPRHNQAEKKNIARLIVEEIGLLPDMAASAEMETLLSMEVLPMYEILDSFTNGGLSQAGMTKGRSPRNLIGQAQMRESTSSYLTELVSMNNVRALSEGKPQFVVLFSGQRPNQKYTAVMHKLVNNSKLTPLQRLNTQLNIELIEAEEAKRVPEPEERVGDDSEYLNF